MKQQTIVLGVLLAVLIAPASAQERLTLQEVISFAMKQSPEALSVIRDRSLRDAESYEIEQRKNPELEFETTILEENASTGIKAELTLPYKPTQWVGDRQSLGNTIRSMGDLEAKMGLLSLKHRVTQSYIDLWLAQEHKSFLQENLQFAHSTQKIVAKASQRGEVGRAVSSLLQAEVLKYEDELIELNTQAQSAKLKLSKMISRPLSSVTLEKPLLSKLPVEINEQQRNLTRELLEARLKIANKRVTVAKKDASFPELSPRLFYSEGFDNDSRTLGIGIRMQWPLSGSNKAELARAQAEKSYASEALAAYDVLGYDALLESGLEQAIQLQARTQKYNKKIIPAFEKSFQAMRQMFKNGQASAIELWQIHERLHEAEIKKLEILQQAFSAEMTLETLMGTTLNQDALSGE